MKPETIIECLEKEHLCESCPNQDSECTGCGCVYVNAVSLIKTQKDELNHLQQENEQLKELLQLAVDGVRNRCNYCINCDEHSESEKCKDCQSNGFGRGRLNKWQWQHADKLKGLGIEI